MKIKRLYINNYKSLVDFELVEPNPFSVFVGPNAAGKSNVFEALEFWSFGSLISLYPDLFGGKKNICHQNHQDDEISVTLEFSGIEPYSMILKPVENDRKDFEVKKTPPFSQVISGKRVVNVEKEKKLKDQFLHGFSRIFINRPDLVKVKANGDNKLRIDAANLEHVLLRLFQNTNHRENINEWLEALVPELDKVEVVKSELSSDLHLRIYEKQLKRPLTKELISDGTFNLIVLLTAVFQSEEPQFLCIEEPENGLNPYVLRELVGFFRELCEEKGHYIWLNTHSPFIVRELKAHEILLVEKMQAITIVKKVRKDLKLTTMSMDEAWLTNVLGGGLPW